MASISSVTFRLPEWVFAELELEVERKTDEARMELAVALARRSAEHGGGPFGAVVFQRESGRVLAAGVNQVVPQACSLLHAEVVALMFAQAELGSFTLSAANCELVTSSEPCVQCLGACYWSGISRLVCGAPLSAAEAAGFDEGPRAEDWKEQLAARGTAVETGVLAASARQVLVAFAEQGGFRYNARGPAIG